MFTIQLHPVTKAYHPTCTRESALPSLSTCVHVSSITQHDFYLLEVYWRRGNVENVVRKHIPQDMRMFFWGRRLHATACAHVGRASSGCLEEE